MARATRSAPRRHSTLIPARLPQAPTAVDLDTGGGETLAELPRPLQHSVATKVPPCPAALDPVRGMRVCQERWQGMI
jgi:hypothetical protein